jgi:formamidopyrimidine-DNA glycosylase
MLAQERPRRDGTGQGPKLAGMPELPEVETIRRQLEPIVVGRRLSRVEIRDPRWSQPLPPEDLAQALTGRRVERLGRRGKYLLWHLDQDLHLVQHLRMTGTILSDPDPIPEHARVLIELAGGARPWTRHRLVVVDPRRFGTGQLLAGTPALEAFLSTRLGLEPFAPEFTAEHLRRLAKGRRAPIKAFLLDQRMIAGIGNIYADEALYAARIHPLRPAGSLTRAQWESLRAAIIAVLQDGIDAQGATIDDFRHLDGVRGSFQDRFRVHRREGEPCGECGGTIEKLTVAGRGTYICSTCQRAPRLRSR